jgi:hypothetical protein
MRVMAMFETPYPNSAAACHERAIHEEPLLAVNMGAVPGVYRSLLALTAEDLESCLDFLGAMRPLRLCPCCGSKITLVDTTFFSGQRSWRIQVPVCPLCEQDLKTYH